ncbi:MAG: enoyl-CoA hydratase/isomerase family protein [Planctomycetia bacterium]|nr:MAG: enoyl-CoA hydratase/isomerase family protein [Planctomycetia bacterium]
MAAFTTIQTASENGVLTVTLNRPDKLNAYNEPMSIELGTVLRSAERDEQVRCVVLTGAGRAFCSGQDLEEIQGRYTAETAAEVDFAEHLRRKFNPVVARIRGMEKPVIAAVNGVAAGAGASFAFACDLRVAAAGASFVMAFVHVGLVPDSGATLTLLQHVGLARATELCMLGEKIPAADAERYGLVNRVVPDEELGGYVANLAGRLAALPPRAIGLTKRALQRAWQATLEDQLEYEALLQQTAGNSADHREGVLAFIQKRRPKFSGR